MGERDFCLFMGPLAHCVPVCTCKPFLFTHVCVIVPLGSVKSFSCADSCLLFFLFTMTIG